MKKIFLMSLCLSVLGCFEKDAPSDVVWSQEDKEVARQGDFILKESVWDALKKEYKLKQGFPLSSDNRDGYLIKNINEQNFGSSIRQEAGFDSILKTQALSRIEDEMAKYVSQEIIPNYFGQSPEELLAWIEAHPEIGCKGVTVECLKKSADQRIDSVYNIQAFFEENQFKWRKKQQYKIAWIRFSEKSIFDTLELKLSQGESFSALANQYSNERESGPKGGELGFYFKGVNPGPLQAFVSQLNTELVDKGEVPNGTLIKLNYQDRLFGLLKVLEYIPYELPQFSDVSDYAREELHKKVVKDLNEQMFEKLRLKYGVDYEYPIPDGKDKEFYELNKKFFLTPSTIKVSVNGKANGKEKCLTGDEFTLPLIVKEGMSWPCGLGLNDDLVKSLFNQKSGKLNTQNYNWTLSAVGDEVDERVKSFERLSSYVNIILQESYIAYQDSSALAKSDSETWVTWGELRQLMYSVSPQKRKEVKRHEWLKSILKRKLYSKFLKESSWIKSPGWLAENEIILNKLAIQYSKIPKENPLDSSSKMDFYKKYTKYFSQIPQHPVRVVNVYNSVPDLIWKRLAYKNDVSWSNVTELMKVTWLKQVYQFMDEAILASQIVKRNQGAKVIYQGEPLLGSYPMTLKETFELGVKLLEVKKGREQMALYDWAEKAFYDSPDLDTLLFVKAKSLLDRNQARKSVEKLKELNSILDSGELHSRVLFMLGWAIVEKVKKPKDALVYFRDLIKKYPKSNLLDDAEFMVKDIESNGRYSAELMKKLGLPKSQQK